MKILTSIYHRNFLMIEARKKRGITQQNLADMVGTNPSLISQIELLRDVSRVKGIKSVLDNIADCLEVEFHKMFPADYIKALFSRNLPMQQRLLFDVSIDMLPSHNPALITSGGDADDMIDNKELRNILDGILDELPAREARVLEMRCGMYDGEKKTWEEIGRKFGVTRERVRQIEEQGLNRMRRYGIQSQLRGYLTD